MLTETSWFQWICDLINVVISWMIQIVTQSYHPVWRWSMFSYNLSKRVHTTWLDLSSWSWVDTNRGCRFSIGNPALYIPSLPSHQGIWYLLFYILLLGSSSLGISWNPCIPSVNLSNALQVNYNFNYLATMVFHDTETYSITKECC